MVWRAGGDALHGARGIAAAWQTRSGWHKSGKPDPTQEGRAIKKRMFVVDKKLRCRGRKG